MQPELTCTHLWTASHQNTAIDSTPKASLFHCGVIYGSYECQHKQQHDLQQAGGQPCAWAGGALLQLAAVPHTGRSAIITFPRS